MMVWPVWNLKVGCMSVLETSSVAEEVGQVRSPSRPGSLTLHVAAIVG